MKLLTALLAIPALIIAKIRPKPKKKTLQDLLYENVFVKGKGKLKR